MSQRIDAIAIDGGGTGTRLRALAPGGETLAEATAGPSSLTLGVAQAWRNIAAGIEEMARAAGAEARGARLVCGLAGGRSPERQAEFRAMDPVGCSEITIVTDGFSSLLGAHGGAPGAVLAIGTGVAAYALGANGRVSSASGWGFTIGDEGGGAWIGRRALSILSQAMDGRHPGGAALFETLQAQVGGTFDAIQSWLARSDSTRFATLAPLVVAADDEGDPVARTIMEEAAAHLGKAIAAVDAPGAPIALLGGLAPIFAPRFPGEVAARIRPPRGGALDGLSLMARKGWRTEVVPMDAAHG